MPRNIMADNSELGRDDVCHHQLTSPSALSMKINSRCSMRSRADTDDDDDQSDSHSDDDSTFSPERENPNSGKFDGSESLQKSKITHLLQSISLGEKTSSSSAGTSVCKEGSNRAWAGSSSEDSHPLTSDEENYSEDNLSEEDLTSEDLSEEISGEDNDHNPMAEIMNRFKNFELEAKLKKDETNIKNLKKDTLHNKNHIHAKTGYGLNIPNSTKNEKNSTSCEDDSEDENNEFCARGATRPKSNKNNSTPYDRESPPGVDSQVERVVAVLLKEYPTKFAEVFAELKSESSSTDGSPTYQQGASYPQFNVPQIYSFPASPAGSPQMYPVPASPSSVQYLSDGNLSSSPIPPDLDWSHYPTMPRANDSFGSPTRLGPTYSMSTVQQSLSSSSSPISDYSCDYSPIDYGGAIDQNTENIITSDFGILTASDELPIDPVTNCGLIDTLTSQQGNSPAQPDMYQSFNDREYPIDDFPSSLSGISDLQALFATTETQNQNLILQPSEITNTIQNSTGGGTVTVTSAFQLETPSITFSPNNANTWSLNNELNNNNVGQIRNSTPKANYPMNSAPNLQVQTLSTSAPDALIPVTVPNQFKQPLQPCKRNQRPVAPWLLLKNSSTPAAERLKQNIDAEQIQKAMVQLYEFDFTERENGDTLLMAFVRDPKRIKSRLAKIVSMLDKMIWIPNSLILRNDTTINRPDALYLAAMNCPEFDYVAGSLVAAIQKSPVNNEDNIWRRKYGIKGDTLIHAVAEKGETHTDVLQELLATRVFDLSAQNNENKTPLHVAVEAHDIRNGVNSAATVQILMEYGADSITKDNNGDTALHIAMSKMECLRLVQALLCNDNGRKAINICNKAGNTPLHLAALLLNNALPSTQETVCYRLIANGARINIANQQNKMPLGLVAKDRRERIEKILHKRS